MKILAVDTSCDDTSAAVIDRHTVLSNSIASQTQLHKEFGGVFPTVAKQAHAEQIEATITAALVRANIGCKKGVSLAKNIQLGEIAALAVTAGPGLAPALEVGIRTCKTLALETHLPLVPVNHIEGHVLSVLAGTKLRPAQPPQFPALSVIVSGGHTQFVLVEALGKYTILGKTVDDAAGECLDKVGRMLNLGYPAAPIIEQFAKKGNQHAIIFPLPMTQTNDFQMSFSGLKTFARNYLEEKTKQGPLSKEFLYDFCASAQYGIFRHIIYKMNKLLQSTKVSEVWLGGGVAQNTKLRQMIRESIRPMSLQLRTPYSKKLCMDNAAMIGIAAHHQVAEKYSQTKHIEAIERQPRLEL